MRGVSRLVQLDLGDTPASEGFLRPLADGRLWSDLDVGAGETPAPRPGPALAPRPAEDGWRLVYSGPGEVGGERRELESARGDRGRWRVRFDDGCEFQIECAPESARIVRARGGESLAPARAVERALGAPLALALAEAGVWLLHAAAVEAGGKAYAFVGASGAGKSTLAAAAPAAGVRRLADDQLPLSAERGPRALPRFPQLKLARGGARLAPPAELPLAAVAVLERRADLDQPRLEPLSAAHAALALVRATVAAKLFDDALLARHIAGCGELAHAAPVVRLLCPSGLDRVEETLRFLLAETGGDR